MVAIAAGCVPARSAVTVLGDLLSRDELEHKNTRRAGRKARPGRTIPLLPSPQLRRRRSGSPDLPPHLRSLDHSGRLLAAERRITLRPYQNREPGIAGVGRLR